MQHEALHVKSKRNHTSAAYNWKPVDMALIASALFTVRLKHCALTSLLPRNFQMQIYVVDDSAEYAFHRAHLAEPELRRLVLGAGWKQDEIDVHGA